MIKGIKRFEADDDDDWESEMRRNPFWFCWWVSFEWGAPHLASGRFEYPLEIIIK